MFDFVFCCWFWGFVFGMCLGVVRCVMLLNWWAHVGGFLSVFSVVSECLLVCASGGCVGGCVGGCFGVGVFGLVGCLRTCLFLDFHLWPCLVVCLGRVWWLV